MISCITSSFTITLISVQKVSLARLLKKERNLSLTRAKDAVDNLMEGKLIGFSFNDISLLENLQKEATSMGIVSKTVLKQEEFLETLTY